MTSDAPPATALPRARFHAMTEGTQEDWSAISRHQAASGAALPGRVAAHLRLLDGDSGGFAVDRLTHSLQTAARAERAGRDDDYVLCALLHDIGDTLAPYAHSGLAAALLEPYVSAELHWMVAKHGEFQGYYFFHYLGLDRNCRDRYAGHPLYDLTAEFCAEYDGPAFDPGYPTPPVEHYLPLLEAKLAAPVRSLYRPAASAAPGSPPR